MVSATLNELFDDKRARNVKLMTCERCDVECERRNNRQKNCLDCGRVVENERRRKSSIPIGGLVSCERCGCDIIKTGVTKKFCSPCIEATAAERYQVRYAAFQAANNVKVVGTATHCDVCSVEMKYKGGQHKYCDGCAGSMRLVQHVLCACCGVSFKRNAPNKKFCSGDCYRRADSEKRKARQDRHREKRKVDAAYIVSSRMSTAIRAAIRTGKRGRRWESLVDYTLDDLITHLEKQFSEGMSWENIGWWHIDHRVPKSSFQYESPECDGFKAAWALTNLQPLWAEDNFKKHAKMTLLV